MTNLQQWAADYKRYVAFQIRCLPFFAVHSDTKNFPTFKEFLAGDISRCSPKVLDDNGRWRL